MALSGKHNHIRQYKLSSIRKLIAYILKIKGLTQIVAPVPESPKTPAPNADDAELYNKLQATNQPQESEEQLAQKWSNDFIKILSTKDAKYFAMKKTEGSIHMAVMMSSECILFEWAKEPYLRFMKVKAFWLPETPKFMEILTDGIVVRELYLAYEGEANLVSVEDSKVKEIPVHTLFSSRAPRMSRWRTFCQLPFDESAREQLRTTANRTATVNRKLAAAVGPKGDASAVVQRHFMATYGPISHVVDVTGTPGPLPELVDGWSAGKEWLDAPENMILESNRWIMNIGNNNLEVVEFATATLIQHLVVEEGCYAQFLTRKSEFVFILVARKKKGGRIYCLRDVKVPKN